MWRGSINRISSDQILRSVPRKVGTADLVVAFKKKWAKAVHAERLTKFPLFTIESLSKLGGREGGGGAHSVPKIRRGTGL